MMVDPALFAPIVKACDWHPGLGFRESNGFIVERGGSLIITDPIYLADVYNANDDLLAELVRTLGVIVTDFGGDDSCPVWWKDPHVILPLSISLPDPLITPAGAEVAANEVGCDSGSFVFLPFHPDAVPLLHDIVSEILAEKNGVNLQVPPGTYSVFYEQQALPPGKSHPEFYRNVVARREQT